MILEIVLFVIASCVTILSVWRKPRMAIPKEFKLIEKEIEEWLRIPTIPSKVEPSLTTGIPSWNYSEFGIPTVTTVAETSMGFSIASMQQQDNSDMA